MNRNPAFPEPERGAGCRLRLGEAGLLPSEGKGVSSTVRPGRRTQRQGWGDAPPHPRDNDRSDSLPPPSSGWRQWSSVSWSRSLALGGCERGRAGEEARARLGEAREGLRLWGAAGAAAEAVGGSLILLSLRLVSGSRAAERPPTLAFPQGSVSGFHGAGRRLPRRPACDSQPIGLELRLRLTSWMEARGPGAGTAPPPPPGR